MFEGNSNCSICRKQDLGKNKVFSIGMDGYTYVFCKRCFDEKKEQVKSILDGL